MFWNKQISTIFPISVTPLLTRWAFLSILVKVCSHEVKAHSNSKSAIEMSSSRTDLPHSVDPRGTRALASSRRIQILWFPCSFRQKCSQIISWRPIPEIVAPLGNLGSVHCEPQGSLFISLHRHRIGVRFRYTCEWTLIHYSMCYCRQWI